MPPPDKDKTVWADPPAKNQMNANMAMRILNNDLPGDNCFSILADNFFSSSILSGTFLMSSLSFIKSTREITTQQNPISSLIYYYKR